MESTLLSQEEEAIMNMKPSSSGCDAKKIQKPFVCTICNKTVSRKYVLIRHMKFHLAEKPFKCNVCEKSFVQKSDLLRHLKIHSKTSITHACAKCCKEFPRMEDIKKHVKTHKSPKQPKPVKCNKVFPRMKDIKKHAKAYKSPKQHKCEQYSEIFTQKEDLKKYGKAHKSPKQHKCIECSEAYSSKSTLLRHMRTSHTEKPKCNDLSLQDMLFEKVKHFQRQNALGVFTKTMFLSKEENNQDLMKFFDSLRLDIFNELTYQLEAKKRIKWYADVQVLLTRESKCDETESATPYFHSNTILQSTNDNLASNIEEAFVMLTRSFEKFTQRGSESSLEKILHLELTIAKYGMA